MVDEPVHLEKYNPLWKKFFVDEQKRLQMNLQVDSTVIQHIGSTAILNIYAKPIIDIMIGVELFPPSHNLTNKLVSLGYDAVGEAGVPERLYLRYRQLQSFNVHIVKREAKHWNSNLAFRDYLQAHPKEAKRYEEIKIKAIQSGASSLLQYSSAKSSVLEELVLRGLAWRTGT
jgi:GrpB-like predicted nucleotidyltransferase (UPF0157 family)